MAVTVAISWRGELGSWASRVVQWRREEESWASWGALPCSGGGSPRLVTSSLPDTATINTVSPVAVTFSTLSPATTETGTDAGVLPHPAI